MVLEAAGTAAETAGTNMTAGRPDGADERDEAAIAWVTRLNSGEAREDDWRAHEAWLAAEPGNAAAYAKVEALWSEIDDHTDALRGGLEAGDAPPVVIPMAIRRRAPARRSSLGWAAAAAAAGLVVTAGGYAFLTRPTVYETAPGQTRQIALNDGTRIDLNGGSRLSVRYDHAARRVAMTGAEAAFDVTKDPSRPFLITAGDQRIRVVGTAFDVAQAGGRVTVTVRRGVVEVGALAADGKVTAVTRVPAGSELTRDGRLGVSVLRAVDPDEAFAWREHRLVFHGAPLGQVAQALDRAFATPIQVQGAAADLPFTGVLVLDDEDAVLRRLQAFLPVEVDRTGAAIVLKPRA
jgi:transmembrane sensor